MAMCCVVFSGGSPLLYDNIKIEHWESAVQYSTRGAAGADRQAEVLVS